MVRKSTQKFRGLGSSSEELEFIFGLMHRGLNLSEIKMETVGTNFSPRGDVFLRRVREQFDAAKKVLWNPRQGDFSQLFVEANKRHFKRLLDVVEEWRNELGAKVIDPIIVWDSLVPNSFTQADRAVGQRDKGPLVWEVTSDEVVEVWLVVEKDEYLFGPLFSHIREEVGETYDSLKAELARSILEGSGRANPEITNLTSSLYGKLELIHARGLFSGTCEVCRSTELIAETIQAEIESAGDIDL